MLCPLRFCVCCWTQAMAMALGGWNDVRLGAVSEPKDLSAGDDKAFPRPIPTCRVYLGTLLGSGGMR